ncbi:MAG: VTT domain-containing protein [Parcubacteria group bacterium]
MDWLADLISAWALEPGFLGPIAFFVGAMIGEMLAPLPSPLLLVGAAFFFGEPVTLALLGRILFQIIIPIALGVTAGSLVIYTLAYKGGKAFITRFSKWLRFTWEDVERMQIKLQSTKSDEMFLLVSRSIPFTPTTIVTIAAGVMRLNVPVYTVLTFLGILIRVSILFVGAYLFGHSLFG